MKLPLLHKIALGLSLVALSMGAQAQSDIYFETFGNQRTLPSGWVGSTPGWGVDSSNTNNAPAPYSGNSHLIIRNFVAGDTSTPAAGTYSVITRPVDASNFTDIQVGWAARRTRNFVTTQLIEVAASATGTAGPWTPLTFVDRPADSNWGDVTSFDLPQAFNRASSLALKFTCTTLVASGTYRIDDLRIEGTLSVGIGAGLKTIVPIWKQQASKVAVEFTPVGNEAATLSVLDVLGHTHQTHQVKGNEATLDLDNLPRGIYWLHLQQGGHRAIRKIALR